MKINRKCIAFAAILIAVNITYVKSSGEEINCCPGENIIEGKTCRGGSQISIRCKAKYFIDPAQNVEDKFEIRKNKLFLLDEEKELEVGQFCVGRITKDDLNKTKRDGALICFPSAQMASIKEFLFVVKAVIGFISVIFLLITLYVYYIIPDLRETQDKVTCWSLGCLMIFFFVLGLVQLQLPQISTFICTMIGGILHFTIISYFAWLNMVMANVFKLVAFPYSKITEGKWYLFNHIYAWTIPTVLLSLLATAQYTDHTFNPNIGKTSCWIDGRTSTWLFLYIPISIMLAINATLFMCTAWSLHKNGNDISDDKKRVLKYKCKIYVWLFLVAGLLWIFEVISFTYSDYSTDFYWIITDIVNGLQGFLNFIVLVVWRKRIRKELSGKQFLCFKGPDKWSELKDSEEEELNPEESQMVAHQKHSVPLA